MKKTTYAVTCPNNGETLTRTSARTYTHAVVYSRTKETMEKRITAWIKQAEGWLVGCDESRVEWVNKQMAHATERLQNNNGYAEASFHGSLSLAQKALDGNRQYFDDAVIVECAVIKRR